MQYWAILVDSLREALDRKIFWLMIGISHLVVAAMFCVQFESDRVSFFFGAYEQETINFDPTTPNGRTNIAYIVTNIVDVIVGFIGILLTLIATAGFFPTMLEKGSIDVLLSKPLSRTGLFLTKYFCGMIFVSLQASVFVVLSFLMVGLWWRVWLPGYLWSIPLMVVLFSYLYCVSVLVAVRTKSAVAAILISLGAWVLFFGAQQIAVVFEFKPEFKEHRKTYAVAQAAYWAFPKTSDITYLATRAIGASASSALVPQPDAAQGPEFVQRATELENRLVETTSVVESVGSSLMFEAVIVFLAIWSFRKRDF